MDEMTTRNVIGVGCGNKPRENYHSTLQSTSALWFFRPVTQLMSLTALINLDFSSCTKQFSAKIKSS